MRGRGRGRVKVRVTVGVRVSDRIRDHDRLGRDAHLRHTVIAKATRHGEARTDAEAALARRVRE